MLRMRRRSLGSARRTGQLFRWLDAGIWLNLGGFYFPKSDPAYDRFRADPRFARFLEATGLD